MQVSRKFISNLLPSTLERSRFGRSVMTTTFQNHDVKNEVDLTGIDATQAKLLSEMVIIVDENDHQVGTESKKNSHLMANVEKGLLHRAFSVFLFNSKNELLVQQRSKAKVTFPDHYANTCCSHPLNVKDETDCTDNIGVKNAAIRRLKEELGITELNVDDLTYITRIHYKARSEPDGIWGEHEIDHILFAQKDVKVEPNANEVSNIRYLNPEQLKLFIGDADKNGIKISPWFRLISNTFLFSWWKNLHNVKKFQDTCIHRL